MASAIVPSFVRSFVLWLAGWLAGWLAHSLVGKVHRKPKGSAGVGETGRQAGREAGEGHAWIEWRRSRFG